MSTKGGGLYQVARSVLNIPSSLLNVQLPKIHSKAKYTLVCIKVHLTSPSAYLLEIIIKHNVFIFFFNNEY